MKKVLFLLLCIASIVAAPGCKQLGCDKAEHAEEAK